MRVVRRRVEIVTRKVTTGQQARAVVEDDYHYFRIAIDAADGVVTGVSSQAFRHPTVLCPAAGDRLGDLVGMSLSDVSVAVMERTDARYQCTHLIDLAGVTVAALARGLPRRVYEATIPDRVGGRTTASLGRDGAPVLEWRVEGGFITGPDPYAGLDLGTGFTGWARRQLSRDEAEAALVLRRAVFISAGRRPDPKAPVLRASTDERRGPIGGCWVWQPERASTATRVEGSTLDFTDRPEALTSNDRDWLAFGDA